MLDDELLPNTRVEMNFEIESDGNLLWQAGADCRVVITRMQLYVPQITFNSEGQSSYMSQYLKNHKWTYLRENIEKSNSSIVSREVGISESLLVFRNPDTCLYS